MQKVEGLTLVLALHKRRVIVGRGHAGGETRARAERSAGKAGSPQGLASSIVTQSNFAWDRCGPDSIGARWRG
jgi:hypothetical protein